MIYQRQRHRNPHTKPSNQQNVITGRAAFTTATNQHEKDCHYHHLRIQLMSESTDVQTHSILTAKQQQQLQENDDSIEAVGHHTKHKLAKSVYLSRHKTKLKWSKQWQMTYKLFLVITIVLFASFSDVLICVAHAADATSLIRASDDEDRGSNNQKYSDLGITSDPLARDVTVAASGRGNPGLYLEKIGALEMSIAAVFNKVAYGTTTKRSIADNVFVPNLTTVPTPQLTTFRYREKEKDFEQKSALSSQHHQYQQHLSSQKHPNFNNKYSLDLEHDHALPTSAPNADILKSNSNPTYPNPNRHHNHGERHRSHLNSTPSPSGHNLLNKNSQATIPMFQAELPSYSPPARSFLTPRVPPEYPQNPFAEQPTLRGTNSESGLSSGFNINRRPIPPPSLMPGHEKIPLRPPDLINNNNNIGSEAKNKPHGSQSKESEHVHPSNSDSERKKQLNTPAQKPNQNRINSNQMPMTNTSADGGAPKSNNNIHFPSISRILSGSNGRNDDIPEVLLRTVTARPITENQSISPAKENGAEKANEEASNKMGEGDGDFSNGDETEEDDTSPEDEFDSTTFNGEEPKTQPKIKQGSTATGEKGTSTKKSATESPLHQSDMVYSTQIIQNMAAPNAEKKVKQTSVLGNSKITNERSSLTTWTVAWNIHVYLSAILFTILAVYSIFKMIFYDKLTHLVNQTYFICLHLILIIICLARIFFLCYDAYNIHFSFHLFISELLLNLPATFLTVSFSILILFLLLRSLNHKNNRYSALMRPLTVVVGSSVHVFLCITLHYVESYGQQQRNQQIQQQLMRNTEGYRGGNQAYIYNQPPRVLSLICQLIYIFICFSLGFFYLYIYKVLKRVLQKKSQNYIHGYQNLSYAIHITIATALLFILLAALQIYGAISISTTRPIMSSLSDNDWLQWGYQFSLRLIEIAIIALLSWVTGLKTGTTKVLQRDKVLEQHNVSGFALFPCTSSSSQEHFETDYPAICNANTNLHSYTLRTGKPIYDDTFALNSLGMENPNQMGNPQIQQHHHHHHMHTNTAGKNNQFSTKGGQDYQVQSNMNGAPHPGDAVYDPQMGTMSKQTNRTTPTFADPRDHLNDSGTIPDHYENPNFELHSGTSSGNYRKNMQQHAYAHQQNMDNCYTEPIGAEMMYNAKMEANAANNYDFQNFERPSYTDRNLTAGGSATEFRASKNLKALAKSGANNYDPQNHQLKQNNLSGGGGKSHYNPQTHNYNSFDRRGIRKSGTLSNIGNNGANSHGASGHGSGRNNALSTLNINSSSGRSIGARTLNAPRSSYNANLHEKREHKRDKRSESIPTNDFGVDSVSIDSSEGVRALNYNPDMVLFKAQRDHPSSSSSAAHDSNVDNAQNSASSGDSSTSMLVADHGFVRFRPMDATDRMGGDSINSDNNNIMNKNSPAIMQRHHKRSLTNS